MSRKLICLCSFVLVMGLVVSESTALTVPAGTEVTKNTSERDISFMVSGRLIVQDGADLTFTGPGQSHIDGTVTAGIRPEIIMNDGSIFVNARVNMGTTKVGNAGNYAYLTINKGYFRIGTESSSGDSGDLKFPDNAGGEHRIYLNGGILRVHQLQPFFDRDSHIIVGGGKLQIDNVSSWDPRDWLKNINPTTGKPGLLPADGYSAVVIEYNLPVVGGAEVYAIGGTSAKDPSPADKATDVPRDAVLSWTSGRFANTHDVYFGTVRDNVNNANRANPLGVLASQGQDANTYDAAGLLDFGQTYYWRIDEVNAPPDYTIYKGDVWSFTAEPFAYPIAGDNIIATASSQSADRKCENTVNGSGLNADGLHLRDSKDMWLSGTEPLGAWIEFQFDKVYKLYEMWVWNYNEFLEPVIGLGFKDVSIEYSVNGINYTTLGTTHQFARAPGADGYAHNTTVDFGGAVAKYVRLTAHSNWGGILPQYGLSEVRFFYIPVCARKPSPASGAANVDVDVVLNWVTGREAAKHDVYLSTDQQAVVDGTAPVTTVSEASYGPLSLDLSTTYYWKVNEVNMAETPTTWEGDLWSFTTRQFLVVDDFESYNDLDTTDPESNRIFNTWIDGYGTTTNGSIVGYENPPFCEKNIIHSNKQSMPLAYSNTAGKTYSEAERTFAVGQDWTKAGVATLVLYFYGAAGNTGQLYVKINGSKVVYGGDAADVAKAQWQQWNIALASLGLNLRNVTKLGIGIDGNNASGKLYFDDIRLYRSAPGL